MQAFFDSGHAVDLVLAVLLAEAIWLRTRGMMFADIIPMLLPAVLMMIALRSALTGMAWPFISAPLALAFPVHIYDIYRRRNAARAAA